MNQLGAAPSWSLCHPVNIYVFKNGIPTEKPVLVHIPMENKKNMTTVLEAIAARMKLQAGYPVALYTCCGMRVCKTYELQMYNQYVVVTNTDMRFKCMDYGALKEPLVVIGHHSKHVNTLKFQNKRYDLFCRRKANKKLHELIPYGQQNGLGPCEMPSLGKPCGALCSIPMQARNPQITRDQSCYTDEAVCMDDIVKDEEECSEAGGTGRKSSGNGKKNQARQSQLMDLIQRYQHVGSDIFKMFQDKINEDLDGSVGSRWKLEDGHRPSMCRVQEEFKKMAETSCNFSFDNYGNYVGTELCTDNVSQCMTTPGKGGHRLSNQTQVTDNRGSQGTHQAPPSTMPTGAPANSPTQTRGGSLGNEESRRGSPSEAVPQEGLGLSPTSGSPREGSPKFDDGRATPTQIDSRQHSFTANMVQIDEENNLSLVDFDEHEHNSKDKLLEEIMQRIEEEEEDDDDDEEEELELILPPPPEML